MARYRSGQFMACSAAMFLLAGCGGGNSAPDSSQAPIAATPPPAPPAPPPPSPPPPPAPSPSVTLVGAVPGQSLDGLMACARDAVSRNADGQVTGLSALTGVNIDNRIALLFRGTDSYSLDVNGFGGSEFTAADKRPSQTGLFDDFLKPGDDEFAITKPNSLSGTRTFVTHGLYNAAGLCFFAAGLRATALPMAGSGTYQTIVDGIARIGGENLRLLPSYAGSSLTINYSSGAATLNLVLSGRSNPFADFTKEPAKTLTTATASLQLVPGTTQIALAPLTGSGGFSGTVMGMLVGDNANVSGSGGSGAVFTFELQNPAGERIFGIIAAERNLI